MNGTITVFPQKNFMADFIIEIDTALKMTFGVWSRRNNEVFAKIFEVVSSN